MTKEFLRKHGVEFEDRNIAEDESARKELMERNLMVTPVTLIGEEAIVGFNEKRLRAALGLVDAD